MGSWILRVGKNNQIRKMKLIIIYVILFAFLFPSEIFSQRMSERMVIFNPLFNTEKNPGDKISWINSMGGWGEFGGYVYEDDDIHAWYQKLGAFLEFFRINDKKSLSVFSNIEFIADPHNDINFNPRAIFWEEAFLYTQRLGKDFWQAGYYHRCKHDVDNLDYGYERSQIFGSIMGRYIHSLNTITFISLKFDLYTILQDYRKSESLVIKGTDLKDLSFSTAINFNVKHPLNSFTGVHFSSFIQADFSSSKSGLFQKLAGINKISFNGGAETGIYFYNNARFLLTLRYEYFSDNGIYFNQVKSNLLSIGVSLQPLEIF
jgi:hypothetical protein